MKTLYTILLLLIVVIAEAQLNDEVRFEKKASVSIGSGISFYSLINNNISYEKFSGTLIPINFIWTSPINDKQVRDFYFNILAGTINNYNINANIGELSLGWDYRFKLYKKIHYDIFLGPAPFIYFHNRQQEMPSKLYINSKFGIISLAGILGIKSTHLKRFNYNATVRFGLLSAGFKPDEDQQTKILTPFNGLQFYFSALASYRLFNWADIALEYSFQTYNTTAWSKMYSLSDQLTLNLILSF